MHTKAHVFISGRVQGVFFRGQMQRRASALGVNGWARNLPDGRVEAVLEGEAARVDDLLAWCHQGPPNALVTRVDVTFEPPTGAFLSFAARY